jgi:hypothetical protein
MTPSKDSFLKEIADSVKDLRHELGQAIDTIQRDVTSLKIDVGGLKIKSGLWGLLGGLIPAIGIALMYLIFKAAP